MARLESSVPCQTVSYNDWVDGMVSCTEGTNGTFAMSEIAGRPLSVSGRVSVNGMINLPPMASCTIAGTFGLLR